MRLTDGGGLDTNFGSAGRVMLPYWTVPAIARDRFGHILLYGLKGASYRPLLSRLSPRGFPDRSFGVDGNVHVTPPDNERRVALAVDRRGRPLLATALSKNRFKRGEFLISRHHRQGPVDRAFGNDGKSTARFGAWVEADGILVGSGGNIVVGGTYDKKGSYGFALARFLGAP